MKWLLLLVASAVIAAKIPLNDARDWHQRADAVLWPAFVSTSNDWAINHQISEPGHLDKLDAKDKKRFDATCEAFQAWREAMKQAGY